MDKNTNFRPPIITVMGHVDHGKTTLLDALRKTNVVAREHGGITQHIGAYQVQHNNQLITFIDTPGHAAFEKMRSRGAEVADIVVLVVAANDSVKPQTVEAIKHIQKAQKPIIVAITKVDMPDVNINKVKKDLQVAGVLVEGLGGDVPVVELAAPKGKGVSDLLEVISLVWQMNPQESKPGDPLSAVVIESFMDKSRGSVVSAIVNQGTLTVGQKITVDSESINIRALTDENGKNIKEAGPSNPVEILGFGKALEVGSIIREITETGKSREVQIPASYDQIISRAQEAKDKFKIILKADVLGSLEAILKNLPEKIMVITSSIGDISQNDISSARAAQAPIIAFNIKVPNQIKRQAEREKVIIHSYNVIYELLNDMEDVAEGFTQAKEEAKIKGRAKIVATFDIEGSPREAGKKVAGAMVTFGKIKLGDKVFLTHTRGNTKEEAKISSLKRFKKDIDTVSNGQDCGIILTPILDFEVGDILESVD